MALDTVYNQLFIFKLWHFSKHYINYNKYVHVMSQLSSMQQILKFESIQQIMCIFVIQKHKEPIKN